MYIEVKQLCGKFFSQVRNSYADGDNILFESPDYLTEAMALADAKCWMAFHGEAKPMDKVTVDPSEVYTARGGGASLLEYRDISAEYVAWHVAAAYESGLTVEIRTSTVEGTKYIMVSNGKGACYGRYYIGAVFADWALNKRWNETA
jgi:hypothetical protein